MASKRLIYGNRQRGMSKQQSGRLGGTKGGQQRARTLSSLQRQEIARKGGQARNR